LWGVCTPHKILSSSLCSLLHSLVTSSLLGWVHTCNVIAYRNTVSWECGRDSCPRNLSKVGYAVTLRVFSMCCRYLAVASKGWCVRVGPHL
jgi:hypothetical protein